MNIRYYFEHVLLRKSYQKDPVKVINKLLTEKENYIYDLIFNAYSDANEPFPFSKADFSVSIEQFDQYEFIIINMPTNNLDTANCTQIILVYSMLLSMYEYFTVEYCYCQVKNKQKCSFRIQQKCLLIIIYNIFCSIRPTNYIYYVRMMK